MKFFIDTADQNQSRDDASCGIAAAGVPFAVLKQMLRHPPTGLRLERFRANWRKTNRKI